MFITIVFPFLNLYFKLSIGQEATAENKFQLT
jgi:hypothetical protein